MKNSARKRMILIIALLCFVFASFGSVTTAFAQDGTPEVPDDTNPNPDAAPGQAGTVIVPNTGGVSSGDTVTGSSGFFLSGWPLLFILGALIIVLMIVLMGRSGKTGV